MFLLSVSVEAAAFEYWRFRRVTSRVSDQDYTILIIRYGKKNIFNTFDLHIAN